MKRLILVAVLGGCGFGARLTDVPLDGQVVAGTDGAVVVDAAPIDMPVPVDGQACFGRGLVEVCFTTLPTGPLTLAATTVPFDTDVNGNCQLRVMQGGIELCVVAGKTASVTGAFVAVGARPLVIVGIEDVTIESAGTIDVSSRNGRKGAGANTGMCTVGTPGEDDAGGGGGGGGGGLGTSGGRGGVGDENTTTNADGTATGGVGGNAPDVSTLRGGCPGSRGGGDTNGHLGGAGGDGGGAVYVIAGRKLTVTGNVFASGAGGGATNDNSGIEQGGGGGGAGGMIGLDGATVDITGRVAANGGAGGGGGDLNTGGKPGSDGSTLLWNERARGGDGANANAEGKGADGAATDRFDMLTPRGANGGGGGGGGGLGIVRIDGVVTGGAQISPPPTPRRS